MSDEMRFVVDGQDLMDYLKARTPSTRPTRRPQVILVDLNMPKKDGREALAGIKTDPGLRSIPVIEPGSY